MYSALIAALTAINLRPYKLELFDSEHQTTTMSATKNYANVTYDWLT